MAQGNGSLTASAVPSLLDRPIGRTGPLCRWAFCIFKSSKKHLRAALDCQDWARAAGFPHLASRLEKHNKRRVASCRRCPYVSDPSCKASCKRPGAREPWGFGDEAGGAEFRALDGCAPKSPYSDVNGDMQEKRKGQRYE